MLSKKQLDSIGSSARIQYGSSDASSLAANIQRLLEDREELLNLLKEARDILHKYGRQDYIWLEGKLKELL